MEHDPHKTSLVKTKPIGKLLKNKKKSDLSSSKLVVGEQKCARVVMWEEKEIV